MERTGVNIRDVASRNRKFGCASEGTGAEKEVGVGMSRFVFNKMVVYNIFENIKPKLRKKIKPTGLIVGKNNSYLTTSHGRLFVIETSTGIVKSIVKIDKDKISRPSVLNQNLFIITDNSIIKLN